MTQPYTELEESSGLVGLVEKIKSMAVIALGPDRLGDVEIGQIREYVIPEGYRLERSDLTTLAPQPRRTKGVATLHDERSFVEYMQRHMTPATVIFAELDENRVTAILNYHEAADGLQQGSPGWGDFRAVLKIEYSDPFREWFAFAKHPVSQIDFAYWLETHIPDVREPDGAELLQIVRHLRITRNVSFERVEHLATGQVTKLELSVKDRAAGGGVGDIELPDMITIEMPIFQSGEPEMIPVYLRYDLDQATGKVSFRLEMASGFTRLVAVRFREVVDRIGVETGVPAWLGVPPAIG